MIAPFLGRGDLVTERARGRRVSGMVRDLLASSPGELAAAYAEANPGVDEAVLAALLGVPPGDFFLCGADLMMVEVDEHREFRVIEVNSAPGFAYCTPGRDAAELAYGRTVELVLDGLTREEQAGLAILTESKVPIETVGFAACFEHALGVPVPILGPPELRRADRRPAGRGVRLVCDGRTLTGGLRYLHEDPWEILPPDAVGRFVNGTGIDLRGARDKVMAHLAYERFNRARRSHGLAVRTPRTIIVRRPEDFDAARGAVGRWAVSKIAQGHSGRGVEFHPEKGSAAPAGPYPVVLQEMLLPSSLALPGETRLRGIPLRGEEYVFDLRIILGGFPDGIRPLMAYGRRSPQPVRRLDPREAETISDVMKVNISVPDGPDESRLETERLLFADDEGIAAMGLSTADLQRATVEAALAMIAVDRHGSWPGGEKGLLVGRHLRRLHRQPRIGPRPGPGDRIPGRTCRGRTDPRTRGGDRPRRHPSGGFRTGSRRDRGIEQDDRTAPRPPRRRTDRGDPQRHRPLRVQPVLSSHLLGL
jgi:hypothetical protein